MEEKPLESKDNFRILRTAKFQNDTDEAQTMQLTYHEIVKTTHVFLDVDNTSLHIT